MSMFLDLEGQTYVVMLFFFICVLKSKWRESSASSLLKKQTAGICLFYFCAQLWYKKAKVSSLVQLSVACLFFVCT